MWIRFAITFCLGFVICFDYCYMKLKISEPNDFVKYFFFCNKLYNSALCPAKKKNIKKFWKLQQSPKNEFQSSLMMLKNIKLTISETNSWHILSFSLTFFMQKMWIIEWAQGDFKTNLYALIHFVNLTWFIQKNTAKIFIYHFI